MDTTHRPHREHLERAGGYPFCSAPTTPLFVRAQPAPSIRALWAFTAPEYERGAHTERALWCLPERATAYSARVEANGSRAGNAPEFTDARAAVSVHVPLMHYSTTLASLRTATGYTTHRSGGRT